MNRPLAPVELRPRRRAARRGGCAACSIAGRRARMVAPPELRLGDRLEVEWALDCPAGDLASVRSPGEDKTSVALTLAPGGASLVLAPPRAPDAA